MTTILIANIGNRDVLLGGQDKSPYPTRPEGQKLLERYDTIKEQLLLPILDPCLDFVLAQEGGQIDRMVLIGTDQPAEGDALKTDKYGVPFRDKDTTHFASLIKRHYGKVRPQQIRERIRTPLVRANPALYDEMMVEYASIVRGSAEAGYDTCYVIATGGTPTQIITLTNASPTAVTVSALDITNFPTFQLGAAAPALPVVISASGGTLDIPVVFAPESAGPHSGLLNIAHHQDSPKTTPSRDRY